MSKRFEDIIAEQGRLIYTSEGDSMFPLIKPRDLLVIEKVTRPLRVGDVPLYKRDSGQYVLHRVVAVKKDRYVMKGDNRTAREKGIRVGQIIGVLTSIVRLGVTYPVETREEYVMRNAADLTLLLSCAINGDTPDETRVNTMDLAEIYRQACEHMVCAAVSCALERVTVLPHAFDQAKKKAIRRYALYETERAAISEEFEKEGINYLPLKGIPLQEYYPDPSMREMIDNDILFDGSRKDDVRAIMERLGYFCEFFGEHNHDVYIKPPFLQFEMHRALFDDEVMPLFDEYYAGIMERTLPDGTGHKRRLKAEDLYIHVLCHTYKHYIRAGSGLRSLLDVYLFLRGCPDLDREYLDRELAGLGIADFEEKIRRLSDKLFCGEELSAGERKELKYFVFSGRGGNAENAKYNKMSENLGGDDSRSSKLRYMFGRVFISGKALEKNYPFVAKHRSLYPLLVLYRPLKGAVMRPKGLVEEFIRLRRFKKKEDK